MEESVDEGTRATRLGCLRLCHPVEGTDDLRRCGRRREDAIEVERAAADAVLVDPGEEHARPLIRLASDHVASVSVGS